MFTNFFGYISNNEITRLEDLEQCPVLSKYSINTSSVIWVTIFDVVVELHSHVWLFVTAWSVACQSPLSWIFPGKNSGVGCHFLLQGIFPTQGLNPCLLHWQVDSLPLSHLGSPSLILISELSLEDCSLPLPPLGAKFHYILFHI